MILIGREQELKRIKRISESHNPELLIVTGRRRVGKTYLINYAFSNSFAFKHTGVSPEEIKGRPKEILEDNLTRFTFSLRTYGYEKAEAIKSWAEGFYELERLLDKKYKGEKQIVFIDEIPWLDTEDSHFLSAFSGFVNNYALANDHVLLIICASSNTYIEETFNRSSGSLYRRATKEIYLPPLTLIETKQLLQANGHILSDYDVTQAYMILGGIPFYLNQLDNELSLAENIDHLFFSSKATLRREFKLLFETILKKHERAAEVVHFLSTKRIGYTRKEICDSVNISDGGTFTKLLDALVTSKIILEYSPFNGNKNENYYKLVDPFCLFFLKFVQDNNTLDSSFWQDNLLSQQVVTWRGYAFENLCFYHIDAIKEILGISGVISDISSYQERG